MNAIMIPRYLEGSRQVHQEHHPNRTPVESGPRSTRENDTLRLHAHTSASSILSQRGSLDGHYLADNNHILRWSGFTPVQ